MSNLKSAKSAFQEIKNKKKLYSILFFEIVAVLLFVYQLFQIILIKIEGGSLLVLFEQDPMQYIFLVLAAIFLAAVYFSIAKKLPALHEAQKSAPKLIKETFGKKITNAKEDSRVAAILLLQFIFAMVIVLSIAIYLDPETNLVQAPWNYILFIIFVAASFWFYRYTKFFREG